MTIACIAAIDQGTSSSRVLIFSATGKVLGSHQLEHAQHYPLAGQVEHDPLELWKNVKICMAKALAKIKGKVQIVGIGITNQRETTVVWNRETGEPYHRAIVWNDSRTNKISHDLAAKFGSKNYFREKTGLPIASYFSATKLLYVLDSDPDIRRDALEGKALFGTIDTWLIWRLTNGQVHATDVTNASRTLLMNLKTLDWDDEILMALDIPRHMLPEIHPSAHIFGRVDAMTEEAQNGLVEHEIPVDDLDGFDLYHNVAISGVIGDQNAALFGQTCFEKGQAKCTYGTGAFLLMNTGTDIVHSHNGLLTTVAYQLTTALTPQPIYALEGSVAYSGSLIQWLRDNLYMITNAKETEEIAASVSDNGGIYFVPAFAGLYAPYWREDARATIVGLTAFNNKAHIVRAALEASAFQVEAVMAAMVQDSGTEITGLQVDGGFSANNLIMQFQSDLLQIPLTKPSIAETTSLGAAFVAGLGGGMWDSLQEIHELWHAEKNWQPHMPRQLRAKLVCLYRDFLRYVFSLSRLIVKRMFACYIYSCINGKKL
jgi:glycerol kinase